LIIRKAEKEDLDPITDMMMRFIGEAEFDLTYVEEQVRNLAWRVILNEEAVVYVADIDGVLGGVVAGFIDNEFSVEPCVYMNKFYVEKEFRGTPVGAELLKAFDAGCKEQGVALSFASSTAGMGETNEKLYVRLFRKCGYETLGRVLIRDLRL